MARARNIKPGFFRNADLVELSMEARLLFIGLWTLADRAGRLEDRPKQIKMDVFPADSVDCDALLNQLAATGMVVRYEVNGGRYLQVVNFSKHQNPHRDEKVSSLPDQSGHVAESSPAPSKPNANTVQAPCEEDASTVAIGLTPDPLIPDSLIPDPLTKKKSASAPTIPDIPDSLMADFLKVRKAKKAPLTDTAIDGIRREADKAGLTMVEAITACVENSWQGFRADWHAERQAAKSAIRQAAPQVESFAERDARAKREAWEQMTGRKWPTQDLPTAAWGDVIDAEPNQIRRIA